MLKQLQFILLCFFICSNIAIGQNKNVDKWQAIVEQNEEDTVQVKALNSLSYYYLRRDLSKSLVYAVASEKLAIKVNYTKGIGKAITSKAVVYMDMGNTDTAEVLIDKAIQILKNEKDIDVAVQLGGAYSIKGHLENNKNHFDKAFEWYLKAVKTCANSAYIEAKKDIPVHYNNIALLYRRQKKYKKGLEYALKALNATKVDSEDKLIRSVLLSTTGKFYIQLGDLDKAFEVLNEALILKTEIDDKIGMITLLSSIGSLHYMKMEYKKAETTFQKVMFLSKEIDYVKGKLLSNYNFSKLYFDQKKYANAIQYANAVVDLNIKDSVTIDIYLSEVYNILAKSHAAISQFKLAYDYQSKYTAIQDTINQQRQKENINELEATYQLGQKEQEKIAQSEILNQQQKLLWGGGISLIVISLVALFLYRLLQQRKSLTESLRQKNEELEELDEAKTRFFANVSHELKTPLTLIISPLKELLKRKKLDAKATFLVESAAKNGVQLFELTNQILELTKSDVQKMTIEKNIVDFASLFRTTSASFESLAANQNINFIYDYQGNAPLYISSDDYKIKTIIKNLISNALKYTDDNGEIKVKAIEKETGLLISVEDNGQGIRDYDLPYIFDRFYQSKNQEEVVKGGTGIGLAICKEYAQLLGGSIQVESNWSKGSLFAVILSKELAEKPIDPIISIPILTKRNKQEISTYQVDLPTILIVEDNLDMQAYLDFVLNPHYNVIKTPHGKAALATLRQSKQPIDLVISDLMMPVMNGYELMEEIKQHPKYANLPTIMLTALNGTDNKLKALRIGINDYMTKPFEAEELLLRIDYLLQFQRERMAFATENVTNEKPSNSKGKTTTPSVSIFSDQDSLWLEELEIICLQHLSNVNLTMTQLAQEMAMSYSKFWRKLQKILGMSPSQYLQELRFREARKFIEAKKYSTIKQVAYAVGFKDERNFARNFKKRFGKNPSEY